MLTSKGLSHAAIGTSNLTCQQKIFFALSLIVLLFLIYSNSFDCAWQFDDITNIATNPRLQLKDLSFGSLEKALTSEVRKPGHLYRPVACLTFALNYYFGGEDVFGYHVVNVVIHFLASLFLFFFIHRTLHLPSLSEKYALQAYPIASLAAILWAIHPIQTQAVTYVVQRMATLAGLFYLISMYGYLRFRQVSNPRAKVLYLVLCVSGFVLSFGSKENGALLPLSLFLYETVLIQRRPADFLRRGVKKILFVSIGVLVLGVAYLVYEKGGAFSFLNEYAFRPFSLQERLLTQPRIVLFYISLLLYPDPGRFSIAHSFQVSTSFFNPPSTGLAILALGATLACLIIFVRRAPLLAFSFLFFFLNHLLESSVFALELVYEHRNYLPSMFFFLPVAVGLVKGVHAFRDRPFMKYSMSMFVFVLLLALGHATFMRNFAWKTHKTLWTDALQKAPDQMRVYYSLGLHYRELGQGDKAIHYYLEGLKRSVVHIQNEAYLLHYELGKAYSALGDRQNAILSYLEAIRLNPALYPALLNLAAQYDAEGNEALAEQYLMKALQANPKSELVHLNLGIHHVRKGMTDAALTHLELALEDENLRARAFLYLGIVHKQKQDYETALVHLKKSVELDPRNLSSRLHLAEVYLIKGQDREGRKEIEGLVPLLIHNQALFEQVMGLLSEESDSSGVKVSRRILKPILLEILEKESGTKKALEP